MNMYIPSNFTSTKYIIPKCLEGVKLHDKYKFLELDTLTFKYSVKLKQEIFLSCFSNFLRSNET